MGVVVVTFFLLNLPQVRLHPRLGCVRLALSRTSPSGAAPSRATLSRRNCDANRPAGLCCGGDELEEKESKFLESSKDETW